MSSTQTLRALVVDDERLARRRLERLLQEVPDISDIEVASSGEEAVQILSDSRSEGNPIDVVFLDVQMPGLSGLDVVREIGPKQMPVTIFVTAYDQHALAAFELSAVDYLLKPFENERFEQTLERARRIINLEKVEALRDRMIELLQESPLKSGQGRGSSESDNVEYLKRIAVESRGRIRVVPVDKIDVFTSEGNYVQIHTADETHLINDTMKDLEDRLDPQVFCRIHRSTIIRLDHVESLFTSPGGDYAVRTRSGERFKVARGRKEDLVAQLGLDT